jgi:ABC-type multidrug transport system fused ATPase/permease subunit
VALVPQQPLLLDGSVADNLRYGAPDADDEAVIRAVAEAGLEEVVGRLDGGLDAELGPGGAGLSVGEVQRLAVARALLRRVDVLVLDEPTSALDPEAAGRLSVLLDDLRRRDKTVLVVSHTDSLLRLAEIVIHLREGRVARREGPTRSVASCP